MPRGPGGYIPSIIAVAGLFTIRRADVLELMSSRTTIDSNMSERVAAHETVRLFGPLPSHFNVPVALRFDNTPADNPVSDFGATLGRVLFYDTRLSANNTISCGSCHLQSHAFVGG